MVMTRSAEILNGRSVLVLDDEESLRQLLHEGLSAQGLRVDCAATAEDALALIRRFWENDRDPLDNESDGLRSSYAVASLPENGQRSLAIDKGDKGGRSSTSQRPGYDILLVDLHLSAGGFFVDGREATARLLEAAAAAGLPRPVVVYMTGDLTDTGPEIPARGEPCFLQKPFRISEVLALFREVLTPAEPQPK